MKLSALLVVLFVSTVSASLLPVEPGGTLPIGAIKQALQREKLKLDHYAFGVTNFDVFLITPISHYQLTEGSAVAAAREKDKRTRKHAEAVKGTFRPLDELKNWAEYTREYKPVLLVRARPKLRETFGSALAQQPASAIRFKGHSLGETAEAFYSIARMAESKSLTKDYCKALLDNSKVEQAHKKGKRNVPVDGCQRVMTALRGEDVKVGNRFAWELGPGEVMFHSGKLVRLQVDVASGYRDVVADMTKKLGVPAEHGYVTYQDVVGAMFPRGKAQWKSDSIAAVVEEYESTVTFVTVTDAHWAAMP